MIKKNLVILALLLTALTSFGTPAYADSIGLIFQGVAKTLFSVFQLPKAMWAYTTELGFPVGLVAGTVLGTVDTVLSTLGGAADIARGAAPYAKYAVFLI